MPSLLVYLLSLLSLAAYASSIPPVAAPATPSVAASTPSEPVSINASEKKTLLEKFKKTLSEQEKNFDRDQRGATKEFTNAQSQQLKDWRNQEKKSRQAYFDQHLSGPDRRSYVQSYIGRKKEFDQKQKDDASSFKIALKERHDQFKLNAKNRLIQFQFSLDQNIRPSMLLWNP